MGLQVEAQGGRPEPTGIAAYLLQRGPVHLLRPALIYATADSSPTVDVEHLLAAHAVWRYAEASVLHIVASAPRVAERLLKAIPRPVPARSPAPNSAKPSTATPPRKA